MFHKNIKCILMVISSLAVFMLYLKVYFSFNGDFNFHKVILMTNKNNNKLRVDQRNEPDNFLIRQRISQYIPYLPIEEIQNPLSLIRSYNFTCAAHPSILDVFIQNKYWQIFYNQKITYFIYGAYLDNRPLVTANKTVIRILAMIDSISENDHFPAAYCHLWFREQFAPVIVPVVSTKSIWVYKWGHSPQHSYPHIISCELSKAYEKWRPQSVSLVVVPCDTATNILRIVYKPLKSLKKKQDFAVCVKGLDFPYLDMSYRFVEYIEALQVFGAQKLIVYNIAIHANISKVFDYYEAKGFLEQRPFTFSMKYPNLPEYRRLQRIAEDTDFILHESIALNDCIYRNMYRFKYIGVWDFDELPIPLGKHYGWHDLVNLGRRSQTQKCKSYASFCFLCAYFPKYEGNFTLSKKYPDYLYMLQHVLRVKEHAHYGFATKCLHDTERLIATHNHFPRHYKADCRDYTFNSSDAQMNHYREPDYKENLTNPVIDKGLRRYGQRIMEGSLRALKEMNFFQKF